MFLNSCSFGDSKTPKKKFLRGLNLTNQGPQILMLAQEPSPGFMGREQEGDSDCVCFVSIKIMSWPVRFVYTCFQIRKPNLEGMHDFSSYLSSDGFLFSYFANHQSSLALGRTCDT